MEINRCSKTKRVKLLLLTLGAFYLLSLLFNYWYRIFTDKWEVHEVNMVEITNSSVLLDIFAFADVNNDSLLTKEETINWIYHKIKHHLDEALSSNFLLFSKIDNNPRNGIITWKEYISYYFNMQGIIVKDDINKFPPGLSRKLKEDIMLKKAYWSDAAKTNPNYLDINEFLAFRHPESSHTSIMNTIEEIFFNLDKNSDLRISHDEFLANPSVQDNYLGVEKNEFHILDKNSDGFIEKTELMMIYEMEINPRNPKHAQDEAERLFKLADKNQDDRLSLQEIFKEANLFLKSKMVDVSISFHDEF